MQAPPVTQDQKQQIFEWIDALPFSRQKKNISRDFSDGLFVAEIMKIYYPALVQLHNYPGGSSLNSKFNNWKTLNEKVFKKLKFQVHPTDIHNIITINPGAIQRVLFMIYSRIRKGEQERVNTDFDNFQLQPPSSPPQTKQTYLISTQLAQKQQTMKQLRNTIEILQTKMRRMQQLNRLKDAKIQSLIRKLQEGIN